MYSDQSRDLGSSLANRPHFKLAHAAADAPYETMTSAVQAAIEDLLAPFGSAESLIGQSTWMSQLLPSFAVSDLMAPKIVQRQVLDE